MNEFEMADFIDGTREMVFMAMDEHGILCDDGHWMTEEELHAMSDAEVLKLYEMCYGNRRTHYKRDSLRIRPL